MRTAWLLLLIVAATQLSGCLLTRLVTAPMRVVGGALTLIPVAGDAAHSAIDEAADVIDEIPI